MGKFTGEVIYDEPQARTKPVVNPALVNALVPPISSPVAPMSVTPNMPLSPQDQRSFNLSQQNRLASEALKRQAEAEQERNPTGAPTEGERTAATLLQRLQFSQQQLKDVLKSNPNAAMPQTLPSMVGKISDVGANLLQTPERQRVEGAQLDLLDAALTLGTGAAYTKEQLKGYQESYFPQIGDAPQTIIDKQARLANVIQAAEIKAGRAAKLVPEVKTGNKPPTGAPTDVKKAPDGNWYSPDPKRPGKYLMWGG